MEGNFYLNGAGYICKEYIHGGAKQEVSICIYPLKIKEESGKKADVMSMTSGCNFWKSCENTCCQFSLVSRPAEKIHA